MTNKLNQSVALLWNNLGLFAAIVLTVWLPGNILVNYLVYNNPDFGSLSIFRISAGIETVLGPIYIGALIYALYRITEGNAITYGEAMKFGFERGAALFTARLIAGLIISAGLLALVVPGVILAVRYALLDPAVVLEGRNSSGARARSAFLTEGLRWQIIRVAFLFYVPFMVFGFLLYMPQALFPALDNMPVSVALDCVLDVVRMIFIITLYLYYREAVKATEETEREAEAVASPEEGRVPETP